MSNADSPSKPQEEVPLESEKQTPVDSLALDARNPRLTNMDVRISDEAVIAHLHRSDDLN